MSEAEWAIVAALVPPARRGGRPRDINVREVVNAIFYVLSTGCQWRALPKDLPRKSTPRYYFMLEDWTARWNVSTERSKSRASPSGWTRHKPDRGDHPLAERQSGSKRGLFDRSARFRRGQEGHRAQASHPRRYAWSHARREHSARQYSGPRWRASCCGACAGAFPSSKRYSPTRNTREQRQLPLAEARGSRSSSEPIFTASLSRPSAGSSSELSRG